MTILTNILPYGMASGLRKWGRFATSSPYFTVGVKTSISADGRRSPVGADERNLKVYGSVHLVRRNPDTFGRDLEDVISRKLTLEESIKDGPFSILTKQRLKMMQREWFEQIDRLQLL